MPQTEYEKGLFMGFLIATFPQLVIDFLLFEVAPAINALAKFFNEPGIMKFLEDMQKTHPEIKNKGMK
ncbi:MAG: hypothetical protein RBG13Loki_2116 [Promethearchaeota archaeon CR_4]|nr:MAG: hypothetical protein RBG13Loki_2116 [Candidatus Lokiarchaeota archaeon CR_4]